MEMKTNLFSDAFGVHVKDDELLIGVGNQAFLYTKNTRIELPQRTRHKKVHGFVHGSDELVLLYSENEFYIFRYISKKAQFQLVYEGETKDWINAAAFLKNEEKTRFVLHMAHSAVLYLQWNSNSYSSDLESEKENGEGGDCSLLELACCTDYSMLYYTCLHGSTYNQLVIMSGNGFGELLIWQPQFAIINGESKGAPRSKTYPLLLRLQAHNGVILSIAYNASKHLLITTSDDRSVKFWQVGNTETGESAKWKSANSVSPMFSCFGHTARVMCAIIIEYGDDIYVVSGGEDSYMCIWNSSGNLILKRRQQFGAPIWQLGFHPSTSTIYISGSTGNVVPFNVSALLQGKSNSELTQLSSLDKSTHTNEFIGNVQFLNHTTIIGLSNKNRLFFINSKSFECLKSQNWQLLDNFPSYKCTVLATKDEIIATCGYQRITLHRFSAQKKQLELLFDGTRLKGTIRSFHFMSTDLYLVSDDLGNCELLRGNDLHVEAQITLVNCREPWITAALLLLPNVLLVSNRNGCIMLFVRKQTELDQNEFTLISKVKHIHGNMGSTFLKLLTLTSKEASILSGGHESVLKYLRLNLTDYTLTICLRKSVPLAWIEASLSDDIVLGFNDNHFVAWSQEQDVLVQLQCGGGHRCWDYHLSDKELCIIFVKQKQVLFHHYQLCDKDYFSQSIDIPRNKWHTRSCNTLRLLDQTNSALFLVSAGDDNIIKVTKYLDGNATHCAEVQTHISSVRQLATYALKTKNDLASWLIFSVGGRAQLCINQIDITMSDNCRITELSTHTLRNSTTPDSDNVVVEARLMAIDVSREASTGNFMLYIANADGKITIHRWHIENPSSLDFLHLIDLKRCPLQLRWLQDPCILLIATTNGEIHVYDDHKFTKKMLQFQLHETGVNTLDAYVDCDNILHILSGGDDENVKHTAINLNTMKIRQKEFASLHNAQVNALAIHCHVRPDKGIHLFGYTCSIDKQIYRINLQTSEYIRAGFTCIDDVKGILIDKNQLAYLYGSGLQIIPLR